MTHRPYQERAIAGVLQACREGKRAPLIVSPTGSGKTRIGVALAKRHLERNPKHSVAWFAHRCELVEQAKSAFTAVGIPSGLRDRVQVVMTQTACSRNEIPEATLAVKDEAHHYCGAEDWSRIPKTYAGRGATLLGLTATPERADGVGLGEVYDALIVAAQTGELIELGHLAPFDILAPRGQVRNASVAMLPVDAFSKYARDKSTVVFAPNIANAEAFAKQFYDRGMSFVVIHGKLPAEKRAEYLDDFDSGRVGVVINVGCLTEGWDSPRAKCAIFARKIGSPSLYLQCVGRVLRPWQDERALIIDLTGVVQAHGPPDEEREYFLEGEAVRRKQQAAGVVFCRLCHSVKPEGQPCPQCGTAPSETEILKAQGIELEKFAGMRKQSTDARAVTLARWLKTAREKGYKRGWVEFKYNAVYGHRCPADVRAMAERML